MKKRITIILMIGLFAIALLIVAQNKTDDQGDVPPDQVNRSLQTFTQLANDQNIQTFGLKSMEQLRSLKPGKQFRKFMIGLDDVKQFKTGNDVNAIIKSLDAIEVSLIDAGGAIQSSIEFIKKDNKWEASGYGLTADLSRVRAIQGQVADSVINTGRLISIPSLKTSFLAIGSGAALNFVVLEDNQALDLRRGATIPASDAILKLVTSANQYNGLPD